MDEDDFERTLAYVNANYTRNTAGLSPLSDQAKVALCNIVEHFIGVLDWIHETDIDMVADEFFQAVDKVWEMSVLYNITQYGSGLEDDPIVIFVKRVSAWQGAAQSVERVRQMLANPPLFKCPADFDLRWEPLVWLIDYERKVAEANHQGAMMVRLDHISLH